MRVSLSIHCIFNASMGLRFPEKIVSKPQSDYLGETYWWTSADNDRRSRHRPFAGVPDIPHHEGCIGECQKKCSD